MSSSRAQLGEAVRQRQQATGESYNHAQLMLRTVPDSASLIPAPAPEQQRWESYLVGLLAPVFARHDAGLPFGIRSVTPLPDQLLLRIDRGDLTPWARALTGAGRAGAPGPRMRVETASKCVTVIEEETGAVVVLDRTFPRQWQTATAAAVRAADGVRGGAVERAVALSRSTYGFEASALLRRARLVPAAGSDGLVHLGVRDETDGRARLFEVGGAEPRAALWHVLDGAPEALYPVHDGPAFPAPRRQDQQVSAGDQAVLDALLAGSTVPSWGQDMPADGIGWGDAALVLGRTWSHVDRSTRDALSSRILEVPEPQWLEMFERLRQWTAVRQRPVHRGLVVDGQPMGNWVWRQLHRRPRLPGQDFKDAALAELVTVDGPHRDLMPYVPPALPYKAALDRVRRTECLKDLLEQDEAMCRSTRAPSVARAGAPDPARGLVIQVCRGYQDPVSAFTLACRGDHTWEQLAEAIDRVFFRDGDEHLAGFHFNSVTWKLPSPGNFYTRNYERLLVEPPRRLGPAAVFAPGMVPDQATALSVMLAPGFALGYLFDYGDRWMHTLRVLRWTHPDEDTQLAEETGPLLAIRPLVAPPGQYYADDAPGWDHYLTLPSLRQARPNAGPA